MAFYDECAECGELMLETEPKCPHCGAPREAVSPLAEEVVITKKEQGIGCAVLLAAAVVFGGWVIVNEGGGGVNDPAAVQRAKRAEAAQKPAPTPPRRVEPVIPGATLLDEEKTDAPMGRRIKSVVSVPREATKEQLDAFMVAYYREQMARQDFRYGPVNGVFVFIYREGVDHTNMFADWVGRIWKPPAHDEPEFTNLLVTGSLVEQVRSALEFAPDSDAVEETEQRVRVTLYVDDLGLDPPKTRRDISDRVAFAATYHPPRLYNMVGSLDALELVFVHKGQPIGRVQMTHEAFEDWDMLGRTEDIASMQDVAGEARDRGRISSAEYDRRLRRISYNGHWDALEALDALPGGSADFEPKYTRKR